MLKLFQKLTTVQVKDEDTVYPAIVEQTWHMKIKRKRSNSRRKVRLAGLAVPSDLLAIQSKRRTGLAH